jgi:DNA-binding NarL/FixJ family response regulator
MARDRRISGRDRRVQQRIEDQLRALNETVEQRLQGGIADLVRVNQQLKRELSERQRGERQPQMSRPPGLEPMVEQARDAVAALTRREREVLMRLAEGKPQKVIAHELGISARTVEVHRARMLRRLGTPHLAQAIRMAAWAELAGSLSSEEGG